MNTLKYKFVQSLQNLIIIIKVFCLALIFSSTPIISFAATPKPQQCNLVSGKLVNLPNKPLFKFTPSKRKSKNNQFLSSTQFYIKAGDGEFYKIIMNNLFYINASNAQLNTVQDIGIIADFTRRYALGNTIDACGIVRRKNKELLIEQPYPSGCSTNLFNGFLRINGENITTNANCIDCLCKTK